jgi:hypothetical protein
MTKPINRLAAYGGSAPPPTPRTGVSFSSRVKAAFAATIFLTVGVWPSPAAAKPAPNALESTGDGTIGATASSKGSSWYGYQTLATDGAAIALALVAGEENSEAPALGALGLYVLGAPTVHALHGRAAATAGSLALRLFLPLLSSIVGGATADCSTRVVNDDNCDFGPRVVGLVVGMAAAVVIDSAAIAWEPKAPPAPVAPATRAASSRVRLFAPAAVPIRGGAGLVFGGLF